MKCASCGASEFDNTENQHHYKHKCRYCGTVVLVDKPAPVVEVRHGGVNLSGNATLHVAGDNILRDKHVFGDEVVLGKRKRRKSIVQHPDGSITISYLD